MTVDKPRASTRKLRQSESAVQNTCTSFGKSKELVRTNQILLKCQQRSKEFPEYVLGKLVTLQMSTRSKAQKRPVVFGIA